MTGTGRINDGIRVKERPSCMLCGGRGIPLYSDLHDCLYTAPGTWSFLRCPRDGLVWLNPKPVPDDIGKLYPGYCTHTIPYNAPNRPTSLREIVKQGILAKAFGYHELASNGLFRAVGRVCSRIGPLRESVGGTVMWLDGSWRGQLLDVGCGNGSLVAPLQDIGWDVTGIDFDPIPAKLAREQYGLKVHEGTLEEVQLPVESFDAITMHHVIEHLPNPLGTLRECWRVLRPGGKLVVVTPNIGSLAYRIFGQAWSYLDPPRHLTIFTCDTLAGSAEQAGFHVVDMRTSPRHASFVWSDSRVIRQTGVHPYSSNERRQLASILEGLVFLGMESALRVIRRDAGEELVLIAAKPSD